jgi:hypothetical protein
MVASAALPELLLSNLLHNGAGNGSMAVMNPLATFPIL